MIINTKKRRKIRELSLDDIVNLNIGEGIRLESEGEIVGDTWTDIPEVLSIYFGEKIKKDWEKSFYYNNIKLILEDKEFVIHHGNTKWFSFGRIK